jgi:hypothetical protein
MAVTLLVGDVSGERCTERLTVCELRVEKRARENERENLIKRAKRFLVKTAVASKKKSIRGDFLGSKLFMS